MRLWFANSPRYSYQLANLAEIICRVPLAEAVKRITAPKLSELIAKAIRRRIMHDRMQPGDALPSGLELINEFNASRPTVREAFRILEAQHLVRIMRCTYGGARVTLPEKAMVAEFGAIYLQAHQTTFGDLPEACILIAPTIVQLLAKKISTNGLARLRDVSKFIAKRLTTLRGFCAPATASTRSRLNWWQ